MPEITVAFAGHSVQINCPGQRVRDAVQYMFSPHVVQSSNMPDSKLCIKRGRKKGRFQLFRDDNKLAGHKKIPDLFISLYDAVIRDVISPASDGLALHAGAVSRAGTTLLVPGVSGAGKSTLTSWLIANDWSYLTDELVYVVDGKATEFLTRPLSIKRGAVEAVGTLLPEENNTALVYESAIGIYLHHSTLNAAEAPAAPLTPTAILFPAWRKKADYRLEVLTPAHTSTMLMNVLVNARNLPRHGVPEIIKLGSSLPAFRLHYSSFDQLDNLVNDMEEKLASAGHQLES